MDSASSEHHLTRRSLLTKGAIGVAGLSGMSTLLAAGGGSSSAATSVTAGPPRRGGTLTVALISGGTSETVDPWKALNINDYLRVPCLYDQLYYLSADNEVLPALAESAEPNADATVWTIRLRPGVEWHDGKPVTADDLLYTLRNQVNPNNLMSYGRFKPVLAVNSLRKRDNLSVEVTLLRPLAQFTSFLATPGTMLLQDGFTDFSHPIGTGPFKFVSFTPGQRSVFKRNPNYWETGKPYLDSLVMDSFYTAEQTRINALLSGSADAAAAVPALSAKAYQNNPQLTISVGNGMAFSSVAFRVDVSPFRDQRVGQALKLLVDRPQILSDVYSGFGTIGNDLGGYSLEYFADDLKRDRDVEQAKSLLKAAGHKHLTLTLDTSTISSDFVPLATLFAQQVSEGGVTVKVNPLDPSGYYTTAEGYTTRPFFVTTWVNDPSLSDFYLADLESNAPLNETHFGNPRADALLSDALGELDKAKATEKWHAVQQVQFESGGDIIPVNASYIDALLPSVHGVGATAAGNLAQGRFQEAWLST